MDKDAIVRIRLKYFIYPICRLSKVLHNILVWCVKQVEYLVLVLVLEAWCYLCCGGQDVSYPIFLERFMIVSGANRTLEQAWIASDLGRNVQSYLADDGCFSLRHSWYERDRIGTFFLGGGALGVNSAAQHGVRHIVLLAKAHG